MNNVSDDWGQYLTKCKAGHQYHESEKVCGECEIAKEQAAELPCPLCKREMQPDEFSFAREDGDGYWVAMCTCGAEVFR